MQVRGPQCNVHRGSILSSSEEGVCLLLSYLMLVEALGRQQCTTIHKNEMPTALQPIRTPELIRRGCPRTRSRHSPHRVLRDRHHPRYRYTRHAPQARPPGG